MNTYREGSNKAKAIRTGIVEQRPVGSKSKRDRPYVVEMRYTHGFLHRLSPGWEKRGTYRTLDEARRMAANQERKYDFIKCRVMCGGHEIESDFSPTEKGTAT